MLTTWTDTYLDISQNSIKADNEISYPWTIYTHHECPGSISTSGNGIHFTPCLPCDVTDCYVVETILAWAEMKGKGLWVVFEVPNFFLSFLFFFRLWIVGHIKIALIVMGNWMNGSAIKHWYLKILSYKYSRKGLVQCFWSSPRCCKRWLTVAMNKLTYFVVECCYRKTS